MSDRSGAIIDTSSDAAEVTRHNADALGLNAKGERPRVVQRADAPLYVPAALARARARGIRHEPRPSQPPREGWLKPGPRALGRVPESKA